MNKSAKVNLILKGLTALLNTSTDMEWDDLTHRINLCFDVVNKEYHALIRKAQEKKQRDLNRRLKQIVILCDEDARWDNYEAYKERIRAIAKGE